MIYKNPYCRTVRRSHLIIVSCGHCKTDLALYQKAGRGRLLRMYIDRIVKGAVDLRNKPGILVCPQCHHQLATKVTLRRKRTEAYILIRGVFNAREVD
ncbi:MAG: hypothetical protein GX973_07170 [Firmicutes bacterium]|nr:hypothetical protein [Bacillota bacterium]